MIIYTVDRIVDGETAVLLQRSDESKEMNILTNKLPKGVKEGDILDISFNEDESIKSVKIMQEETESAKQKAENLLQKIINKNKPS